MRVNHTYVTVLSALMLFAAPVFASSGPLSAQEASRGQMRDYLGKLSVQLSAYDHLVEKWKADARFQDDDDAKALSDAELQIRDLRGDLTRLETMSTQAAYRWAPRVADEFRVLRDSLDLVARQNTQNAR